MLAFPNYDEREEIIARIRENSKDADPEVWVTPGLPLLIFITSGLIVALTFGDIVWFLISSVLF